MTTRDRLRTRPPPARERERERTKTSPPIDYAPPSTSDAERTADQAAARSTLKVEAATITAGRSGERNIAVAWIDVWIGNSKPVRFDITTASGNGLEAVIEQGNYRKAYSGTGKISTLPIPVAPIGTKLSLTITDTTTGEKLVQNGVWYAMGFSLWALIKRLLWKG